MKRGGFTRIPCPKCGGNIYLDNDSEGWYEKCLQCGYTFYLPETKVQGELVK